MPKKSRPQKTKTGLKYFRKFNHPTAAAFAAIAAIFGIIVLIKTFAATGTLKPQGTYTNWKWASTAPQQSTTLDTYLSIESDPTLAHPGYGYYWASQFGMVENGGYMGVQTNGQAGAYTGKVAIFALWAATEGVENGSDGSNCTIINNSFDGGQAADKGSTCRVPLNWQTGDSYRLRLSAVATGRSTRTWQANVINTRTGQDLVIGRIKTTLSYGLIQPWLSNWTEYYSAGRSTCEMPYSRVTFGTPVLNENLPAASHQNNLTNGGCTSTITDSRSGVRHEQGNPSINGTLPQLPTGGTYVSDLSWTSATTGYGTITKDQSVNNNGTPINLAGRTFAKGLGTHAISDIRYRLNGGYSRFVSYVNLQYGGSGNVTYEVWADNTKLFDSGPMDGLSQTQAINVDVTGKQELRLVVTDGGNGISADWAAWADARLIPAAAASPPPPPATTTTPPTPPAPSSTPASSQGDITAPSVNISSPVNGSKVYNGTYIVASSSDNVAVKKIELYIDGALKSSAVSSSISYTWTSYYAAAGTHTITVKAYDAAGNIGQATVSVTK